MTIWNWQLRDRYLEAARQLDYEVECNWSYYTMKIPGDVVWCYLWHPANKMRSLERDGNRTPEIALNHMRDNQSDFHIELDRHPQHGSGITHLFAELWHDPSVATIVDCIRRAQDPVEVAQLEFIDTLHGDEE